MKKKKINKLKQLSRILKSKHAKIVIDTESYNKEVSSICSSFASKVFLDAPIGRLRANG